MNTRTLLPFTAAAVFALCAGSMVLSADSYADTHVQASAATASTVRVVDLPAVTVSPEAADLAHYLTYKDAKIVNLPAVTVNPQSQDLAYFLANQTANIVDMPAITVRPSAEDLQLFAAAGVLAAQQLAAR